MTPLTALAATAAQAIVVLTGGHWKSKEVMRLQRATGLPVLASGGDGEATTIKAQLERDSGVPVRWTEGDSLTTRENALFFAKILAGVRVQKIILVTHALHMPRAKTVFRHRPGGDSRAHGFFERSYASVGRFLVERRRPKNKPVGAA